jgi:putative flavoprotein involved in K+ transport
MPVIDTVVIGAGHAGLSVSRLLTDAGRDHVVLDRGRVAERWRTRWDSLHLVTPSWMNRLPGFWYGGPDPDGYLPVHRFVAFLEQYARLFSAPVVPDATVLEVSAEGEGYRVVTDVGTWRSRHVVVATGPHGTPYVPPGIRETGPAEVLTSDRYRNPGRLAPGGVLIVGASASGVQIADELARAGRHVVLSVGRHSRMPRRYRGMDAFWWLDATGRLSRTLDEMPDPAAARREPSLQLVGRNRPQRPDGDPASASGSDPGGDLDLGTLQQLGVRLVGRLGEVRGGVARFGSGLDESVAAANEAMHRYLDSVDRYVDRVGLTHEVWPAVRPRPVHVPPAPRRLDLRREGIGTVLVAAGYRPDHPWLRLPVTGPDGHIAHHRGVTPAPGLYVVGQRFQERRDSAMIAGARHTARSVAAHLLGASSAQRLAELNDGPAA